MCKMSRLSKGQTERQDCDYVIKTILLGDLGVGKTTFLYTYLHGHVPAMGSVAKMRTSSGHKTVAFDGKKVRLTLWDTAGQERYRSLTASYYRGAHACIVLYDKNNVKSLENVSSWLESLQDYSDSKSLVTLMVGVCKKHSNSTDNVNLQQVDHKKADDLASHHQIPHFEVDCHSDPSGLDFVIQTLVTMVMTKAIENQLMSQTIQPYSTKLNQMAQKRNRCSGCCNF